MLSLLHIENVAVIERADIEFGPGLNVLTGETGAGKSIVIDSINAILGARSSKELVRSGASAALISAELTAEGPCRAWLEENGVESEEGELIVTRRITAEGKSTCRVNGVPVSAAQLRELGDLLIDVHGQNDGRRLLSEASHRAYLDGYAALGPELETYAAAYKEYAALKERLEALRRSEEDKDYRIESLRKRVREIRQAEPKEGELEALSERRTLLVNAERITGGLHGAYQALYGGESSDGALALIQEAEGELSSARRYTESLEELAGELSDLRYRAEDLAERMAQMLDELDFSPGELDRVESRLSVLSRLRKKYGSDEEMTAWLQSAENELEDLEALTENTEKAARELREQKKKVLALAAGLTVRRREAGERLARAVEAELAGLNMPAARFEVELLPKEGEEGFDSTGADTVRFLLSANPGEEPGRIARIASGGELSRIMLAMKTVLSGSEEVPTLTSDEIDTGVSGRTARKVAEKLARVGKDRQVLCVTHLPQLAVMADAQYLVEKASDGNRTYTRVERLEGRARLEEIARITGGSAVTETLLESADELLREAADFKKTL